MDPQERVPRVGDRVHEPAHEMAHRRPQPPVGPAERHDPRFGVGPRAHGHPVGLQPRADDGKVAVEMSRPGSCQFKAYKPPAPGHHDMTSVPSHSWPEAATSSPSARVTAVKSTTDVLGE